MKGVNRAPSRNASSAKQFTKTARRVHRLNGVKPSVISRGGIRL